MFCLGNKAKKVFQFINTEKGHCRRSNDSMNTSLVNFYNWKRIMSNCVWKQCHFVAMWGNYNCTCKWGDFEQKWAVSKVWCLQSRKSLCIQGYSFELILSCTSNTLSNIKTRISSFWNLCKCASYIRLSFLSPFYIKATFNSFNIHLIFVLYVWCTMCLLFSLVLCFVTDPKIN